jgi:glycosyltransferase involved in cell wall biosynthesis
MKDIEIILVDDNSRDNSINIIEELQRNDLRIKIIKNKKNRGPLYSKSIGVLKSKREYLMILDSDDLFTNEKLFNICFKEVKDNNIDILEFSGFCYKNILNKIEIITIIPLYLRFQKNNQIIKQPYLSNFIYKKKITKLLN